MLKLIKIIMMSHFHNGTQFLKLLVLINSKFFSFQNIVNQL